MQRVIAGLAPAGWVKLCFFTGKYIIPILQCNSSSVIFFFPIVKVEDEVW